MLSGDLRSLEPTLSEPVQYKLCFADIDQPLNELIGREIRMEFMGKRHCIACGRSVNKTFQNGYCFPCVRSLAECDLCIVKPHECHFHLGTCRDETFAASHCMIPHYVYLAWSSGFKVGLTRKGRQLKRWMDQGATAAVVIGEVPTRRLAGELEMEIAKHMQDKTDWRKMLKEEHEQDRTLAEVRDEVIARLAEPFMQYVLSEMMEPQKFVYPREETFKVNLKSMNFDKAPLVQGTLRGMKGQYMLFDEGVLNVKKFAGYRVAFDVVG
ncbi:DUF2797 domain-containing protein [Alicyclobacillus fodiniaquatilis]|uniref:DUF2797 domain-containing protein n=1 Tax=Alicyclobacillus fodiniaquatilis TaxID=1661150 RepID=A0ABW4JHF6_9BACL